MVGSLQCSDTLYNRKEKLAEFEGETKKGKDRFQ